MLEVPIDKGKGKVEAGSKNSSFDATRSASPNLDASSEGNIPARLGESSRSGLEFHSEAHRKYIEEKEDLLNQYPVARKYLGDWSRTDQILDKMHHNNPLKPRQTLAEAEARLSERNTAHRKLNKLHRAWQRDIQERSGLAQDEVTSLSLQSQGSNDPLKFTGIYDDYDPGKREQHVARMDRNFSSQLDRSTKGIEDLSGEQQAILAEAATLARAAVKILEKAQKVQEKREKEKGKGKGK